MRPSKDDMVRYKGAMVTPKQAEFLEIFSEIGDFNAACREVGLKPTKVRASLGSSSAFSDAYEKVMENLADDFSFSKVKNLTVLGKMRDNLFEQMQVAQKGGDVKSLAFLSGAAIKCTQEINKMIEGNLAAQKKIQENVDLKIEGVLDLTPKDDRKVIDVEYEDLDEQDGTD